MLTNNLPSHETYEIVSYDSVGVPLSRKDDDVWDMEHLRKRLSEHSKFYMARIFCKDTNYGLNTSYGKNIFQVIVNGQYKGNSLSIGTLRTYYKLLKDIGLFCHEHLATFEEFLGSPALLVAYAKWAKQTVSQPLIGLLLRLQEEQILHIPYEIIGTLRSLISSFEKTQTLAIPPRILSIKTYQFEEIIDLFIKYCRKIGRFAVCINASPIYGRSKNRQEFLLDAGSPTALDFNEAVRFHGLQELQDKFGFTQIQNFSLFLTLVQFAAKSLIHLFTAARHSEVLELKYGCLGKILVRGMEIPTINGAPVKKKNIAPVAWVTSNLGVKAIKAARILSKIIYTAQNVKPRKDACLFISVSYSPFTSKRPKGEFPQLSGRLDSPLDRYFDSVIFLESDYEDLRHLLPLGEVDNHPDLVVGQPWKLASHQFRRSFGVYGTASGLASYPSLKKQFHHFKITTSIAYGEGGSGKVVFGGDESHIQVKYDDESLLMDACLYVNDVLFSSEKLYGPKGRYIEKSVKPTLGNNIRLIYSDTVAAVRKGTMAYADTILGGCTTTELCLHQAHGALVVCTGCPKGVIKKSKLISVIDSQRELVSTLDSSTVEFRTEKEQLKELELFLINFEESEAENE